MKFRTRYMKNDYEKNYVVMDDDSMTEQQGYKTTTELYEEMLRAGKTLAANRLGMSYDEYLDYEEEEPFELRYELDPVQQQEIFDNLRERLQRFNDKKIYENDKERTSREAGRPVVEEQKQGSFTQANEENKQ